MLEVVFQECASHRMRGAHFCKKIGNKWCNAKMHAKCVLQLTFLIQIGNKIRRRQFLLQLARHWLVFFENHKSSTPLILERPGGMHRGAGGRFEGGQRWSARFDLQFQTSALNLGRQLLPYGKGGGFQALRAFRRTRPQICIFSKALLFGRFQAIWWRPSS